MDQQSPPLPLTGVTVIELCHSISGPYVASVLAELGAEVIKVEQPEGGDYARDWGPPFSHGTSSLFHVLNRNKSGVAVDLRSPQELAALKELIQERADVVVQNLRPGAIDKYGLDGETLRARKPSLIYCNVGAFGATGPLRERPGYDPLMQAFGGLMSITGADDGEPVRIGTSIIDMGSGMWAAIGILAALVRRGLSGEGCVVDTSLYETAIAWMAIPLVGYLQSGEVRKRMGSGVAEIVPHQAFPTADGYLMIAAGNDQLFRKFATALGHGEWADDPAFRSNNRRVVNRERLVALLEAALARETTASWMKRLDEAGVPAAPIRSVDEVARDEQTQALNILQRAPDKDIHVVGVPLSFDGIRPGYRKPAPELGQDTAALLGGTAHTSDSEDTANE